MQGHKGGKENKKQNEKQNDKKTKRQKVGTTDCVKHRKTCAHKDTKVVRQNDRKRE